jgi:hypothetical protein
MQRHGTAYPGDYVVVNHSLMGVKNLANEGFLVFEGICTLLEFEFGCSNFEAKYGNMEYGGLCRYGAMCEQMRE